MGRRTLVLVLALVLAGLAALAIWRVLSSAEEEAKAGLVLVPVYRSGELLAEGADGSLLLSQDSIILSEENQDFLPLNAITTEDQLRSVLTGRFAAGPISENQILTTDQWVEVTEDLRPLKDVIPEGSQAMTIRASAERGVNEFIQPGDRVNVIVTTDLEVLATPAFTGVESPGGEEPAPADGQTDTTTPPQEVTEKTYTRFVMQNVPVLAVGREIVADENAPKVVEVPLAEAGAAIVGETEEETDETLSLYTLEVTPDQAERLAFSYETSDVWLTLVPDDYVAARTEGVIFDNLYPDFGVLTTLFPGLRDLEILLGLGG